MDKRTFADLFREAIRRALGVAGLSSIQIEPIVQYHGKPNPPEPITIERAVELLWLSTDRFYQIVDVGAFVGGEDPPVLFVRVSGHEPQTFAETWDPEDLGPFKVVEMLGPARN